MNLLKPVERFSWSEYRTLDQEQSGSSDWLGGWPEARAPGWKVPFASGQKVHHVRTTSALPRRHGGLPPGREKGLEGAPRCGS